MGLMQGVIERARRKIQIAPRLAIQELAAAWPETAGP